jgi:predicted kinase
MLIAMAGLPGTGKSTVAARLAVELDAVILDKDRLRPILFPAPVLDYSREEDDICMTALFRAAGYILKIFPTQSVVIDGRTFLRSYQVNELLAVIAPLAITPHFIECVCADEVARERLARDLARGGHPARNRTFELYQSLKAAAEPIAIPHFVLDTGARSLDKCVRRCLEYLSL